MKNRRAHFSVAGYTYSGNSAKIVFPRDRYRLGVLLPSASLLQIARQLDTCTCPSEK